MNLVKGNYTNLTDLSMDDVNTVYKMYCGSGFPIYKEDYKADLRYATYVGIDDSGRVSLWDEEESYGDDRELVTVSNLTQDKSVSDGSTASYYELPEGATELQHLISHKNMNAQIGEIMRSCYRYGESSHSSQLRDAKKVKFYIEAEIERLEKLT